MINIFIFFYSLNKNNSTDFISNDNVKFTIFGSIAFAASSVKMREPGNNVDIVLLDTKNKKNVSFLKVTN